MNKKEMLTKEAQLLSLTEAAIMEPKLVARAVLSMGMYWDGKALYNKRADELHEQLRQVRISTKAYVKILEELDSF